MDLKKNKNDLDKKIKILEKYMYPDLMNSIMALTFTPKSRTELKEAVDLMYLDCKKAFDIYSHIKYWNVSKITDMSCMFADATSFNQLLNFNTSSVTNMSCMFDGATSFNQLLNFNTSNKQATLI